MHVGLIGGIGPSATDFYYRRLIQRAAEIGRDLELTMVHADARTLVNNLGANDQDAQIEIFYRLTERLRAAGAECVVVTSIAGHFCIDGFAAVSTLPILDITDAVSPWLKQQNLKSVGILGTDTVMTTAMYGKLGDVEVLQPKPSSLHTVHHAYVTLAQSAAPIPDLHHVFFDAGAEMISRGAQAILLGGTDLNVVFAENPTAFPIVDCAQIHVDHIAQSI
ncbi:MAG: aspartate/glutamate racemase family protein [Pseudomonadota bacterium]